MNNSCHTFVVSLKYSAKKLCYTGKCAGAQVVKNIAMYYTLRYKNVSKRFYYGKGFTKNQVLLFATLTETETLRDMHISGGVTLSNQSCNLSSNYPQKLLGNNASSIA